VIKFSIFTVIATMLILTTVRAEISSDSLKLLIASADKGNAQAQCLLGKFYLDRCAGSGEEKNCREAMQWYLKAANQGIPCGQNGMGLLWEIGRGVKYRDAGEAMNWFRKAAEQGYAEAQAQLGFWYEHGVYNRAGELKDIPSDIVEAAKWYRLAAMQGNAHGQCFIGRQYRFGDGVERDEAEAVKWLKLAADQGDSDAWENLIEMFDRGEGRPLTDSIVLEWCLSRAPKGHVYAQYKLGLMYDSGKGVSQNDSEAVKWYGKAALQYLPEAQIALALMYETGRGVSKNNAEAVRLYKIVADKVPVSDENYRARDRLKFLLAGTTKTEDVPGQASSLSEAIEKYGPSGPAGLIMGNDGVYQSALTINQKLAPGVYLVSVPSSNYIFHCTFPTNVKLSGLVNGTMFMAVVRAKGEYDYQTVADYTNTVKKIKVLYAQKMIR